MKNLLVLLAFILTITGLYAQTEKEQVAVLELKADDLSDSERAALTERLRSELITIDSFSVVEKEIMNKILDKNGFQTTACNSNDCAVKAGKILNVKKVYIGNIIKIGDIYSVTIRIIDVKSGKVIKLVTEDCQCSIGQVLTGSIPAAAAKLSGMEATKNIGYSMSKGKGDIFIESNPAGADIYIDNVKTGKVTPATLRGIAAGNHEIKVEKGDSIGLKIVTIFANDLTQETFNLFIKIGVLMVYSEPMEADILINGEHYGKTPNKIEKLPVGKYQIILKDSTGLIYERGIEIGYNEITKINAKLGEPATLKIITEPRVANVYIDGSPIGKTKLSQNLSSKRSAILNYKIYPRNNINIKVKSKDYVIWEKSISLKIGDEEEIKAVLEREKGKIKISSFPVGYIVYANDEKCNVVKNEIILPTGYYSIKISCPGFLDKEWDIIKVREDKPIHIDASLEKKTKKNAIIRSAILPGWGVAYQEKGIRSWAYGVTFIGSLTGSIYYTRQYNPSVKEYNEIRKDYEEALDDEEIERLRNEMNAKYDEVTSFETKRNIFYIATGAIWIMNMVDVLYFPPAWEKKVELSAAMKGDKVLAGVTIKW